MVGVILFSCKKDVDPVALSLKASFANNVAEQFFNTEERITLQVNLEGSGVTEFSILLQYETSTGKSETVYVVDEDGTTLNLKDDGTISKYKGARKITFRPPINIRPGSTFFLTLTAQDAANFQKVELKAHVISSFSATLLAESQSYLLSKTGSVLSSVVAFNNPGGVDITYCEASPTINSPTVLSYKQRPLEGLETAPPAAERAFYQVTEVSDAEFFSKTKPWVELTGTRSFTSAVPEKVQVETGKIYTFKNQAGKNGLFRVNAIVLGEGGYISISVKCEN